MTNNQDCPRLVVAHFMVRTLVSLSSLLDLAWKHLHVYREGLAQDF
jgi:hypothetical protein